MPFAAVQHSKRATRAPTRNHASRATPANSIGLTATFHPIVQAKLRVGKLHGSFITEVDRVASRSESGRGGQPAFIDLNGSSSQQSTDAPTPSSERPTQTAPSSNIQNCSPQQTDQIQNAIQDALSQWLTPTISLLTTTPISPQTVSIVDRHFRTTEATDIATIAGNLQAIAAALPSARIECENLHAYCLGGDSFVWKFGSIIHICPSLFGFPPFQWRRALIHETAHVVGFRGDVYCDEQRDKYKKLSTVEALKNADSYAGLAGELSGTWKCLDW